MAISLLKAKKLPKQYWIKAMSYAVYPLNCCPTKCMQVVLNKHEVVTNQVLLILESLVMWLIQRP